MKPFIRNILNKIEQIQDIKHCEERFDFAFEFKNRSKNLRLTLQERAEIRAYLDWVKNKEE